MQLSGAGGINAKDGERVSKLPRGDKHMRPVVSEQEVNDIIDVLALATRPGTLQPFLTYTPAVRLLVSGLVECYDLYPMLHPNPDGDFLCRLIAAFDALNSEMAISPSEII